MLTAALIYLLRTIAAQRNPLTDFLNALTNWAVRPARRLIPGLWGLDLATLVLAWLIQFLEIFLVFHLAGHSLGTAAGQSVVAMALLAVVSLVRMTLYILIAVLIVQAVISWVNPYSPMAPMLNSLSRPFLRPFQRIIPPVANVDLSPLFVIVACQLLLMLPVAFAENQLLALL